MYIVFVTQLLQKNGGIITSYCLIIDPSEKYVQRIMALVRLMILCYNLNVKS